MAALDEFLKRVSDCAHGYHVSETNWDCQCNCAIQILNSALAEEAWLRLREVFPDSWSRCDASQLPDDIADIVNDFGGFRDGQFIAASATLDGIRAWVWWSPWSDQVTVSIRFGLLGNVTDSHSLALQNALLP
jgi:hypothetical protein